MKRRDFLAGASAAPLLFATPQTADESGLVALFEREVLAATAVIVRCSFSPLTPLVRSKTNLSVETALLLLDIVHRSGRSLAELVADLKVFPQVIVNVKVREKKPLEGIPTVAAAIRAAETELADSGRVVIRYSGTEALARVMIEAESEPLMRHHADTIAAAIRTELGI